MVRVPRPTATTYGKEYPRVTRLSVQLRGGLSEVPCDVTNIPSVSVGPLRRNSSYRNIGISELTLVIIALFSLPSVRPVIMENASTTFHCFENLTVHHVIQS